MFCTKCGAKMDEGQRFCSNCGAPASTPEEERKPLTDERREEPRISFGADAPTVPPSKPEKQKVVCPEPPKRSGSGKWIVLAILGVVFVALAALTALRWSAVSNFATNLYEKTFLSPEDYYQHLERRNVEKYLDSAKLKNQVDTRLMGFDKDFFAETELRLSLNQDALSDELLDLLEDEVGMDVTWLKNIGLYLSTGKSGDLGGGSLTIFLNDKDIISADCTFDPESETLYARIPELSGRYLKIDAKSLGSGNVTLSVPSASLDPEVMTTLVDRYSEIVINDLTKVEKGRETVTAGGYSAGYTVLEVQIDGEVMQAIAKDVLKKAQNDEDIKDLIYYALGNSGYTGAQADEMYGQLMTEISDALERLETMDPKEITKSVLMNIYVDGNGRIRGRDIKIYEDQEALAEISYALVASGLKYGLRAEFKQDNSRDGYISQQDFILDGSGSVSLSRELTGSFDLSVKTVNGREGSEEKVDMNALKFDLDALARTNMISYELNVAPTKDLLDKALENADDMPAPVEDLIRGLSMRVNGEVNNKSFSMDLALLNDKKDLLTLTEKFYEVKEFDISLPTDALEAQEWAQSIDYSKIEGLMKALTDAGMPASALYSIGNYL